MSDARESLLAVRLSSLGDLVHTLPVIPALRAGFPDARLDWVVDRRWLALMQLVEGLDAIIPLDRSPVSYAGTVVRLRRARYSCAVDFQGLYRTAVLTRLSGARRRVGRDLATIREPGCERFYNERYAPAGRHIAEMSVSLAVQAGGRQPATMTFPLRVPQAESERIEQKLAQQGVRGYLVLSPGGGWTSKRWPPERFGALASEIWRRHGIRSVVNVSPKERELADGLTGAIGADVPAAGRPLVTSPEMTELAALLAAASVVVGGDTGPVHLAAALGTRVVALFGSTDPARNGPLPRGCVVQNSVSEPPHYERGDYPRGREHSPAMLSISVEQVLAAVEQEMSVTA